MSAQLILNPTWKMSEVLENTEPTQLGRAIVELVHRDGLEQTSDSIGQYPCWKSIDPSFTGDDCGEENAVAVEGYGIAYDSFSAGSDGDYEYSYGLLTDGVLMTHYHPASDYVAVDTSAEDAFEKLKTFESDMLSK